MKLLFDQNLSWRLPKQLTDLFPDSDHIRNIGMTRSEDVDIWDYAKTEAFVIVSKDNDFQQRSLLFGHPPKVILLRVGNCRISLIHDLLREHSTTVHRFFRDDEKACLVIP